MIATRILTFLGIAAAASASSVTFDFNTVAHSANASAISTYMNGVLAAAGCSGCSVTVTGAIADTTYNGEGHVTGPGSAPTKSLTLGTSDGVTASNTNSAVASSYDTFIANTSDSSTNIASQITMKFTGLTITGGSFDFEIFPDGTCPSLPCGSNTPDMIFEAGTNSNGIDAAVNSFGTNGTQYGLAPGSNGTATHSVLATGKNTELAPQYIGTWAGSLSNVNELDFIDWPATIGVDNLSLTFSKNVSTVPEPFSVVLLGTAVAGLVLRKKLSKTSV